VDSEKWKVESRKWLLLLVIVACMAGRKTVERTLFWRIKTPARDQKAVRRGAWKYLQEGPLASFVNAEFIFNLEQDPGERQNMVVERADLLPEFRKSLAQWEADVERK
jgi:hypothetical protein